MTRDEQKSNNQMLLRLLREHGVGSRFTVDGWLVYSALSMLHDLMSGYRHLSALAKANGWAADSGNLPSSEITLARDSTDAGTAFIDHMLGAADED